MAEHLVRTLFLSAAAVGAFVVEGAPARADESLALSRVGARTDRPNSTIEARGELVVDDADGLLTNLETGGLSIHFEYTDTVSDPDFADGDPIPGTEFTWNTASCSVAKSRRSAKCKDRPRNTYIKLRRDKKAAAPTFNLKAYVRRITPALYITPDVGEDVRVVLAWTDASSGLPAGVAGVMDRCDWKRGHHRTTRHLKCPTRCGGSPLAVCGSSYCEGSPKCE